jgi:hypothetical protein
VFVGGGTAGGYGISLKDSTSISYEYLVSVMNSRLLEWIVQKTSSKFRGGSYAYGKQYIEDLPIATGEQTDVIEELIEDIIFLVQESREGNEDKITTLENLIDFLVYEMYFDEKFDDTLLETTEGAISNISDPKEKAKKVKNSPDIEKNISDMKEVEWVEIVDSDKLRDKTW